MIAAASRNTMAEHHETILWTSPQGIRCVILPYDETRYQLKLMRELGMIKPDLYAGYANAVAASRRWREEIDVPQEEWPPPKGDRRSDCLASDDWACTRLRKASSVTIGIPSSSAFSLPRSCRRMLSRSAPTRSRTLSRAEAGFADG